MPLEYNPPDATPDPAYFTVAEARSASFLGGALSDVTKYPDADIDAMRVAVEEALEHACGVAFVQRDASENLDGTGGFDLFLPYPRPQSVTSCSIGGLALTSDQLAALVLYRDGRVYNPSTWPRGRGNVAIVYQHGYLDVPGRVKRAAMILTRRFLVDSPVSDRSTTLINPDGTTQYMVTAGVRDAIFDVPEANAIVNEYGVGPEVG